MSCSVVNGPGLTRTSPSGAVPERLVDVRSAVQPGRRAMLKV